MWTRFTGISFGGSINEVISETLLLSTSFGSVYLLIGLRDSSDSEFRDIGSETENRACDRNLFASVIPFSCDTCEALVDTNEDNDSLSVTTDEWDEFRLSPISSSVECFFVRVALRGAFSICLNDCFALSMIVSSSASS